MSLSEEAVKQEAWLDIKQRLEYSRRHTKSGLKCFEAYYLKQKEPKWAFGGGDPIPLVYRLWLSPDHSPAAWDKIAEKVLAYPSIWRDESLNISRAIIFDEAGADRYDGEDGAPLGFMGGAEQAIFEFFMCLYESRGDVFLSRVMVAFQYYEDLRSWLEGRRANPFNISRYWVSLWFASLNDEYMKQSNDDVRVKLYAKKYLAAIARYSAADADTEPERLAYCCAVRDGLETRPIPVLMKQWWEEAKAKQALVT